MATAGHDGRPSVRFVLVKRVDARGFVFFTDARSRKGRELGRRPRAALAFYWNSIGRQVRVEGRVARVSDAESDAYWVTRPRDSRLAASASTQSATLSNRARLTARVAKLRRQFRGKQIPRPIEWTGFRLSPERIEFWTHRRHRLHQRELFERRGRRWTRTLLQP